jgi:hypothetical protein
MSNICISLLKDGLEDGFAHIRNRKEPGKNQAADSAVAVSQLARLSMLNVPTIIDKVAHGANEIRNRGIFLDRSRKGRKSGNKRKNIPRADITINGVRFKKRGRNKVELGRWLRYVEMFGGLPPEEDEAGEAESESSERACAKWESSLKNESLKRAFSKWQKSEKGKAWMARHRQTDAWKATAAKSEARPERKAWKKAYKKIYSKTRKYKDWKNNYEKERRMAEKKAIAELRARVEALEADNREMLVSLDEALKECKKLSETLKWNTPKKSAEVA